MPGSTGSPQKVTSVHLRWVLEASPNPGRAPPRVRTAAGSKWTFHMSPFFCSRNICPRSLPRRFRLNLGCSVEDGWKRSSGASP